jgi:hypothetical protein
MGQRFFMNTVKKVKITNMSSCFMCIIYIKKIIVCAVVKIFVSAISVTFNFITDDCGNFNRQQTPGMSGFMKTTHTHFRVNGLF